MIRHDPCTPRMTIEHGLRVLGRAIGDLVASSIHTFLAVGVLYALLAFGLRWAIWG